MNVVEMAKKYYPRLWGAERIAALVDAGRLTETEAAEIVGAAETERDDGNHQQGD